MKMFWAWQARLADKVRGGESEVDHAGGSAKRKQNCQLALDHLSTPSTPPSLSLSLFTSDEVSVLSLLSN